jgi:hypothetical protein
MKDLKQKSDHHFIAILWVALGVLGRLLPHPANMTPMSSVALFGGTQLSRRLSLGLTLATLAVSDVLLARLNGHEAFGLWSLFTYTGFAAIALAGGLLRSQPSAGRTLGFLLGSSFGFWLWTNFGVWISGGLYPVNGQGLVACYVAALPFLRNALVGDLSWGLVLFLSFQGVRKLAPRFGLAVQGA